MFYRINANNEIIEKLPSYYRGYHADIEPHLDKASDEQKRIYAIPEHEIVELSGDVLGSLFTDSGIPRYVANAGKVEENPKAVKEEAIRDVITACDKAIWPLLAKYPASEVLTFPTKRALAYRWIKMSDAEKQNAIRDKEFALLVTEAAPFAEVSDIDALVVKIIKNSEQFENHCALCIRAKKNIINRIMESAGTRKAVDAIKADMVFPSAE